MEGPRALPVWLHLGLDVLILKEQISYHQSFLSEEDNNSVSFLITYRPLGFGLRNMNIKKNGKDFHKSAVSFPQKQKKLGLRI
jgi:hypothetical protein